MVPSSLSRWCRPYVERGAPKRSAARSRWLVPLIAMLGCSTGPTSGVEGGERAADASVSPGGPADGVACKKCGSTCVDIRTDASHCGECYSRCAQGMTCKQGRCESPMAEIAMEEIYTFPTAVNTGRKSLLGLTDGHVFFQDDLGIKSCEIGNCQATLQSNDALGAVDWIQKNPFGYVTYTFSPPTNSVRQFSDARLVVPSDPVRPPMGGQPPTVASWAPMRSGLILSVFTRIISSEYKEGSLNICGSAGCPALYDSEPILTIGAVPAGPVVTYDARGREWAMFDGACETKRLKSGFSFDRSCIGSASETPTRIAFGGKFALRIRGEGLLVINMDRDPASSLTATDLKIIEPTGIFAFVAAHGERFVVGAEAQLRLMTINDDLSYTATKLVTSRRIPSGFFVQDGYLYGATRDVNAYGDTFISIVRGKLP